MLDLYLFNIMPKSFYVIYNYWAYKCFLNLKNFIQTVYVLFNFSETKLKFFTDLVVVDYPIYLLRFLSVYNIYSITYNSRFFLKVFLDFNWSIQSITSCYVCASWFERESWDLFGIFYYNNLDLRRILNDYGFYGHPLKKDFPLSGYYEISFSLFFNLVYYKPINLNQEFRFFSVSSPWNITNYEN